MWQSALFFGALLLFLEVVMRLSGVSPAAFALPSEVLRELPRFVSFNRFGGDVIATLVRSIIAFAISFPAGLVIGAFAYKAPRARDVRALVDFLRSIPGTSLVPVFFVIFGIGEVSKIAAAVYGGALTVAISTIVGLSLINRERRYAIERLYGSTNASFLRFEFPEILPTLLVGLRTSISLCLVLVTVSEMFMGTDIGLGSIIMDSRYAGKIPVLYTAIFITGVLGFALNRAANLLEKLASSAFPRFY